MARIEARNARKKDLPGLSRPNDSMHFAHKFHRVYADPVQLWIRINEKGEHGKNMDRLAYFRHVPIVALSTFQLIPGPVQQVPQDTNGIRQKGIGLSARSRVIDRAPWTLMLYRLHIYPSEGQTTGESASENDSNLLHPRGTCPSFNEPRGNDI